MLRAISCPLRSNKCGSENGPTEIRKLSGGNGNFVAVIEVHQGE
jgi:hypothetical protein